jgi:hypothetical protein
MPKPSPAKTTATTGDLNALLLALLIEAAEREEPSPADAVRARPTAKRAYRHVRRFQRRHELCDDDEMTIEEFKATLSASAPPIVSVLLRALWHDARGAWDKAHEMANGVDDKTGAWVHAYLHRKEGDLGNAGYWYRRAGQPLATDSLDAEWDRIVTSLLSPEPM